METNRIRYEIKPFAVAVIVVLALELGARFLPTGPLLATGVIRLLDTVLILGITWMFGSGSTMPGVIPLSLKKGIEKGLLWAAGFGALAGVGGIGLLLVGINPLTLIRVGLPSQWAQISLFLIVAGIIGPIAEELFFRGVVFGFLRRWGMLLAIAGSTALFICAHHLKGGIPIPQTVGGLVFAISYETEKNLLVPITIHISGNLALFTLSLIF